MTVIVRPYAFARRIDEDRASGVLAPTIPQAVSQIARNAFGGWPDDAVSRLIASLNAAYCAVPDFHAGKPSLTQPRVLALPGIGSPEWAFLMRWEDGPVVLAPDEIPWIGGVAVAPIRRPPPLVLTGSDHEDDALTAFGRLLMRLPGARRRTGHKAVVHARKSTWADRQPDLFEGMA